jgi:hypothetical protein
MLLEHRLLPVAMEYFSADPRSTKHVIEHWLSACDAVLLIAGARYGSAVDETGESYVEWEFQRAVARRLPVVVLLEHVAQRQRHAEMDPELRRRQDEFVHALERDCQVAYFKDEADFAEKLSGALKNLYTTWQTTHAGYVRAIEFKKLEMNQRRLTVASTFEFVRQRSLNLSRKKGNMNDTADHEREVVNKILDLLHRDMAEQPLSTSIVATLMSDFIGRLCGFFDTSGFRPASMDELKLVLTELFADSLSTLRATSIHSNHTDLVAYKGYWEDRKLGEFFKRKNKEFLNRSPDQNIMRVFACDSIAGSVAEDWLRDTVMKHVRDGALVKIVEIDAKRTDAYEDFGLYDHRIGNSDAGTYLLLAPRRDNIDQEELRTAVTGDSSTVRDYQEKFTALWDQSAEPLTILRSRRLDEASRRKFGFHGEGCVDDLFGKHVILRKMEPLDDETGRRLLPPKSGFVRKYQPEYASALANHIKRRYPYVRQLFYVGDTYKNDGTAIRNLQALKDHPWKVSGFICEPKLKIKRLWFNSVLYTDRWSDLIGFADAISDTANSHSLALFDIDQTLWGPKGLRERALGLTRTEAILSLLDDYVDASAADVLSQARSRVGLLYSEIGEVEYLNRLTLDNEDYKAAICVFLALNVFWDSDELESKELDEGVNFFNKLRYLESLQFLKTAKRYLRSYIDHSPDGEKNIGEFMRVTLATVETDQFDRYGAEAGIIMSRVKADVERVFRDTMGPATVKFPAFRAKELDEALRRAVAGSDDSEENLVLNKAAWDLASWLKKRNVELLAVSDRPEESTIATGGESLLKARMRIYGTAIGDMIE